MVNTFDTIKNMTERETAKAELIRELFGQAEQVQRAAQPDLPDLINAIPIAEDGHIITSEYHNTLRAALLALADRLGVRTLAGRATQTWAPQLLPGLQVPPWEHIPGNAIFTTSGKQAGDVAGEKAARGQDTRCLGWMQVDLPDGALIRSMTVTGALVGQLDEYTVQLLRQPLKPNFGKFGGEAEFAFLALKQNQFITLIEADLSKQKGVFQVTADFEAGEGLPANAATVNNAKYKYLVAANCEAGQIETLAVLSAVQITCDLAGS